MLRHDITKATYVEGEMNIEKKEDQRIFLFGLVLESRKDDLYNKPSCISFQMSNVDGTLPFSKWLSLYSEP